MVEHDLIWLTLLVFMPSLFALALLFFPRGYDRAMCWWSLAGTAVTLGLAIAVFILYYQGVVDHNNLNRLAEVKVDGAAKQYRDRASLEGRVTEMDKDPASSS